MHRSFAWITGAVALVLSVAAAAGAYQLAGYSWDQVVSYESPFADPERPWTEDGAPIPAVESSITPRVVLVIVDGLRLDVADSMPQLATLRQYGADMIAVTAQPSLSYPTWTTILSGASPDISGVTTNWFDGPVPVETLIDSALSAGLTVGVSAPDDFVTLYEADRAQATFFREWTKEYMTSTYVEQAISIARDDEPSLLVIHAPDVDEAGHDHGGISEEYLETAGRVGADIATLVEALQDDRTLFVITADHGHIDAGGHGGWEQSVTQVPALFLGPPASLERGQIEQVDIAPTIAAYLGIDVPMHAQGRVRADLFGPGQLDDEAGEAQASSFAVRYVTRSGMPVSVLGDARTPDQLASALASIRFSRLQEERAERLPQALALGGVALLVLAALFVSSWRAGLAAGAGTLAYYAVYNGLYFWVRGHEWSLSAFNTEEFVQTFFYIRMAEAAFAGLVAAGVAAAVYPLLRKAPKGPGVKGFLGGWLTLGPATVLAIIATLALQVAWFLWAWGADVVWRLPDLKWGFKYDLDLTQVTALGAAALLAPVVTYLVGRYHPRVRNLSAEE